MASYLKVCCARQILITTRSTFSTQDPLSLYKYRYVGMGPVNHIDPRPSMKSATKRRSSTCAVLRPDDLYLGFAIFVHDLIVGRHAEQR